MTLFSILPSGDLVGAAPGSTRRGSRNTFSPRTPAAAPRLCRSPTFVRSPGSSTLRTIRRSLRREGAKVEA